MRNKVITILLSIMCIFIITIIIVSNMTINKYNNISKNIDNKIINEKNKIEVKKKKLKELKNENDTKEKQVDNIDNYIKIIKEDLKEYEKK